MRWPPSAARGGEEYCDNTGEAEWFPNLSYFFQVFKGIAFIWNKLYFAIYL